MVRDVTPPAFRLRYELRHDGRCIGASEECVTDVYFLFGARATRSATFAYEDALLHDRVRLRLLDR